MLLYIGSCQPPIGDFQVQFFRVFRWPACALVALAAFVATPVIAESADSSNVVAKTARLPSCWKAVVRTARCDPDSALWHTAVGRTFQACQHYAKRWKVSCDNASPVVGRFRRQANTNKVFFRGGFTVAGGHLACSGKGSTRLVGGLLLPTDTHFRVLRRRPTCP
jgi:hypothetical protein